MSKPLDPLALARAVKRCQKLGKEGRFPAGPGLSLVVTAAGRARFVHRYPWCGKYESLWLDGCYPRDVTLAEARRQCEAHRELLDQRISPKSERRDGGLGANPTLAEYARHHFKMLATPKDIRLGPERSEWLRDMTIHVGALASTPIDNIVRTQIVAALAGRWVDMTPTPSGKRILMRLKNVLAHRHDNARPDDEHWQNPASLKAMCNLLGKRPHRRTSRPSLSWIDLPTFMTALRAVELMSARALEWVILTGSRSAETTGARWGEINWRSRTWTIPPERLKTEQNKGSHGQPFVIPLSLAMVQLLRRTAKHRRDLAPNDLIFPSGASIRPKEYGGNALLFLAQDIAPGITVHGFRASLVAWGAGTAHRDRDPFALDLMDRVIGHQIGSRHGQATALSGAIINYAHDAGGDLYLPRRKAVMREWSAYLGGRTHSPKRGPARAPAVLALAA
ncbi:MAG TPA: integrase family protein [Caulobacteraceae bacterium]|jgi:integrase